MPAPCGFFLCPAMCPRIYGTTLSYPDSYFMHESGSFLQKKAKEFRKPVIVLWLFNDLLALKTDVNVTTVSYKQKSYWRKEPDPVPDHCFLILRLLDAEFYSVTSSNTWWRGREKNRRALACTERLQLRANDKEGCSFAEEFAGPMQNKSFQYIKGSWQHIPPTMLNFYQLHNVLIVKSIASFSERKVSIFSLFSGGLKGLSYEIDFKNFDENWQILALTRATAGFWIFQRHLWFLVEIEHLLSGKC